MKILESGCKKIQIDPKLGDLEWAEGVYPTPLGDVSIKISKDKCGKTVWDVKAPEEIAIVEKEKI